jgi:hypothetical protein
MFDGSLYLYYPEHEFRQTSSVAVLEAWHVGESMPTPNHEVCLVRILQRKKGYIQLCFISQCGPNLVSLHHNSECFRVETDRAAHVWKQHGLFYCHRR